MSFGAGQADTRSVCAARQYAEEHATDDVLSTMRWLEASGYVLTAATGGTGEYNGGVRLVYTGQREVAITRDRGQWFLDVADAPGGKRILFELLLGAMQGMEYADWQAAVAQARGAARLPDQLPPAVSWQRTLPSALEWLGGPGAAEAVALASDRRYAAMWPDSRKARALRRRWQRQASPSQDHSCPNS